MRTGSLLTFLRPLALGVLAAVAVPGSAVAGSPSAASAAADSTLEETPDEPPSDADQPTRAPPHADCGHRMPLFEHVVAAGEHLGGIAGRYGVFRRDLLALNPAIKDPNLIRVGESVRVCPEIFPRIRERKLHRVAAGETLSEIAEQHGLTVDEVVSMQDAAVKDPNRLRVGQQLVVWVDGGLVEAFRPPPPPPKGKRGGAKRPSGKRAAVSVKLRADERVHVKRPHLAYGTSETIEAIDRAIVRYRSRFTGAPKVLIGDISKQGGGKIDPHVSHQQGRDVDVGYVLTGSDGTRTRFSGVTKDNFDAARTWGLVKSFLDTHRVSYIFMDYALQEILYEYAVEQGTPKDELDELFQYPRGRGRSHGIVRHWKSHRNHFHVRFRG